MKVAGDGQGLRVLLVEDNIAVATAMLLLLEGAGFVAAHADSGAAAKQLKQTFQPEITVVDLQLPDTSGVSLVRWLVDQGGCGVVVLSGLSDEIDRVTCLELGADDYIVKPPNPREFVARLLAVHRRVAPAARGAAGRGAAERGAAEREAGTKLALGACTADVTTRELRDAAGQLLELTSAEWALLTALAAAPGRTVSRDALSQAVLHRPWRPDDRSIDQLVFQLRRKLGSEDVGRRLIQSVRGEGYLLVPNKS
jgi:DNA-binding response OmpR family regulator